MSVTWRVIKTASRVYPPWRRSVKQFENFFRKEHYYSPIPRIKDVQNREQQIFKRTNVQLNGIDLDVEGQLQRLAKFTDYTDDFPFPEERSEETRFWLNNKYFPYFDAVLFHGMLRHVKPTRIVEVGSGFSSAVCLDTNQRFFDDRIKCTFIDPDTSRLDRLLTDDDRRRTEIIPKLVQDVSLDTFRQLQAGDILFVDSSHVAKVGSDVNHLYANVLPALASGVYIHFHDIFYPFEYPKDWIYRGVAWNEAYMLRSFLQYNERFRIFMWGDYLLGEQPEAVKTVTPWHKKNSGSIWIQKQ